MGHQDIIDRFHGALAKAKTSAEIDKCRDRAWELLPAGAAEENTIVIRSLANRRDELKNKRSEK